MKRRVKSKDKRSYFLIAVVIFVLLLVFILSTKSPSNENTIIITDSGFSPDSITIKPGTTVTWINEGEGEHWPASNFHPTHEIYPEGGGCIGSMLDACRGLKKGESYSFTFNKLGAWGIHDHLYPGLTMVVKVVENIEVENELSAVLVESFRKLNYAEQMKVIKNMSKSNPEETWDYLKKAFLVDGQVVGNAHEFAHIIGNEIYRQRGLNGITMCDDKFAFGCYHGVTEQMLLDTGRDSVRMIQDECTAVFPPQHSMNYTGCIHGMGHGLFAWENLDANKAVEDCDMLDSMYRPYCYEGVFMEHVSSVLKNQIDENNPWLFCSAFNESYHRFCAKYQVHIFERFNWNLSQIAEACSIAPSVAMKEPCFSSIGFSAAQGSRGNIEKIKQTCSAIFDEDGYNTCITYAAVETVFQEYAGWKEISLALCDNLANPDKNKCLDAVNDTINRYKK